MKTNGAVRVRIYCLDILSTLFCQHFISHRKMTTNVDARLLRQTKFPPEFNRKVDMTKVNIEVMKK